MGNWGVRSSSRRMQAAEHVKSDGRCALRADTAFLERNLGAFEART